MLSANTHSFDPGEEYKAIHITTAPGMVRLDAKHAEWISYFENKLDDTFYLEATYLTEDDIARIEKGQSPGLSRICDVQAQKDYISSPMSLAKFNLFKYLLLKQESLSTVSPEIQKELLGVHDESERHFSYTLMFRQSTNSANSNDEKKSVITLCFTLINGIPLMLTATSFYQSDSDLVWSRETIRQWHRDLIAANQSLPVSPVESFDIKRFLVIVGIIFFVIIVILMFIFIR